MGESLDKELFLERVRIIDEGDFDLIVPPGYNLGEYFPVASEKEENLEFVVRNKLPNLVKGSPLPEYVFLSNRDKLKLSNGSEVYYCLANLVYSH